MTLGGTDRVSILLVDDSVADIELALEAFEEVGLAGAVRIMRSGGEALEWLKGQMVHTGVTSGQLPDLILLDLKLPGLDGLAVLHELKSSPEMRWIPVVILTSSREQNDIRLAYEAGASSYLVKPLAFEEFLDVVRKVSDYWLLLNVALPRESRS